MCVRRKIALAGLGLCLCMGPGGAAAETGRGPVPVPVAAAPADAADSAEFVGAVDRIWDLARSGRTDAALTLLDATRKRCTHPAQLARIEAMQTLLVTVTDSGPTAGAAPETGPAPELSAELDLEGTVAQAWALAREGKLAEALTLTREARPLAVALEQISLLDALETTLATLQEAAGAAPLRTADAAAPAPTATGPAVTPANPAPLSQAAEPPQQPTATLSDLWSDPRFREQFVGSYAMTAASEPKTSDDERRVLTAILDLMSKDQAADALALLERLHQADPPPLEELGIMTDALAKWEIAAAAAREAAAAAATAAQSLGKDGKPTLQDKPAEPAAPRPSLYDAIRGLVTTPAEATPSPDAGTGTGPETPGAGPTEPAIPPPPCTVLRNPSAAFAMIAGNICFQKGDTEAAATWYKAAVQSFPSFMRAYRNLGLLEVRRGDAAAAIEALTRALELGANEGMLYGLLGYSYAAVGDHLAAEVGYRTAILRQPGNGDWKLGLTRALLGQSRFAEAATLCGRLIAEKPRDATLWRLQGKAYMALQQPLQAAENYEYLRLLGSATVEDLNALGDIYTKADVPDDAVDAYLAALAASTEWAPDDYIQKAKLMASGTAPEAAKRLLLALEERAADRLTATQRKELLRVRAWIASREGVDQEQAALLEEIVRLDPTDGDALVALGQYHARTGNSEKAVFYYERAAGIERVEAKARIRHAQMLVQQSKYEEALPLLKRALQIEPRDDIAAYLKQVESAARSRR